MDPKSGSAPDSFDPDDNINQYLWRRIDVPGTPIVGNGPKISVVAPLGTSEYQLMVADSSGGVDYATTVVTVIDSTAPHIASIQAVPDCLWPPNDKWATYRLGQEIHTSVQDACDSAPRLEIGRVDVIENHVARIAAPEESRASSAAVCLRSAREGTGVGRIYRLTIKAMDATGNTMHGHTHVVVPHDQGVERRCRARIQLTTEPTKVCVE